MNVKTKYTSSFLQANSPGFYTQASTEMKSPGLASLSSFNAGKALNSPYTASPERRLAKSDIIYVSRTDLERELQGFVDMLVQDKAVNENDTTQYLEHLKRLVINLIKENTKLQSTPRSARLNESPYSSPKSSDIYQKLEEFDRQKMIYEEKIKSHSLYILKLEDKVDDLVKQCQGLMKINYEISGGQIPQGIMSPIPPTVHSSNAISRGPDSADRGFGTPKKYSIEQVAQLVENEQGLVEENEHLKQEISSLREFIYRLENETKEKLENAQQGNQKEKVLLEENNSLKNETAQLKGLIIKLEKELRKQQAPQTQALANEQTQIKANITNSHEMDKNTTSETTNKLTNSLTQLQEENSRLKEELQKKENTILIINKEGETLKTELDKALKRLNTEDEFKSQRGEESYVLKDSVLGEEVPKSHRRTESGNIIREEENSKILRERNVTPSMKNLGEEVSVSKSFRDDGKITQPELLRKQLGEYKAANAILHRKCERYLTQIGDLNEALKLANENLDKIQNRCITLEKELVNKNKLESIITSHISLISKLEVMINNLTEDNLLLQKANEENMIMITELKAQLQEAGTQEKSEGRYFTPPRSGRRRLSSEPSEHSEQVGADGQQKNSARSPPRSPDSMLLERDFIKKKYEEKVKAVLHEKEVEMRTERIKHKNQIEKYNTNLEILSKKIKSLVTVNDNLGKDFEILKIEFANYKNVSWAIVQEVRKCLDNFKKHDSSIDKGLFALESAHGELAIGEIKEAYEALRNDIMEVNEVIEERRKYL